MIYGKSERPYPKCMEFKCSVCGNCACCGCVDNAGYCTSGNEGSVRWRQYKLEKLWEQHKVVIAT